MARSTKTRIKIKEFTPEERELKARYPKHSIKPGSLLASDHPRNPFPGKRVVTIICPLCDAPRQVCTSDLFHCFHCVTCAADVKRGKRATKAAKRSA